MKTIAILIATYFVVFAAGFGMGAFTMYLKQEPLIFAWIESASNWQYQAESNDFAAEFYRNNAVQNAEVAVILKSMCDNYTAENAELNQQIEAIEQRLNKVLNPGWEVN